jgi:hypothetical protein
MGPDQIFSDAILFMKDEYKPDLPKVTDLRNFPHQLSTICESLIYDGKKRGWNTNDLVKELIQNPALLSETEAVLSELGVDDKSLNFLGKGDEALVFKLTDNQVARLSLNRKTQENISSDLLIEPTHTTTFCDGKYIVEVLTLADTQRVTPEDIGKIKLALAKENLVFADDKADNLGYVGDRLLVIDRGAVWSEERLLSSPHQARIAEYTRLKEEVGRSLAGATFSSPSQSGRRNYRALNTAVLNYPTDGIPVRKMAFVRHRRQPTPAW